MKIINYLGKESRGIFIGMSLANLIWWVQPDFSQGLQLIREGNQSVFLAIALVPLLFLFVFEAFKTLKNTPKHSLPKLKVPKEITLKKRDGTDITFKRRETTRRKITR